MFLWAEKCQEKISNFERHACLHQKWGTGVKLPWLSSTVQNDTSCQDSNQVENLASKKDYDLVMSNLPISTCLKGKFTKQCVHIFYQKEAFQEFHGHLPLQRSHHRKADMFFHCEPSKCQRPFQLIHFDDITISFVVVYTC